MLRHLIVGGSIGLLAACSQSKDSVECAGVTSTTAGTTSVSRNAESGGNGTVGGSGTVNGGAIASGGAGASGGVTTTGTTASSGGTIATTSGGSTAPSGGNNTGGNQSSSTSSASPLTGGTSPNGGNSAVSTGGTDPVGHAGPPYLYPQNSRSSNCVYPATAHSGDAKAAYALWKSKLVTSDGAGGYQRVLRPDNENNSTNTTVSEGIGYGMILAVVMDDQSLFDNLWRYSQLHLNDNGNGLMIWLIDANGNPGIEDPSTNRAAGGSATDADEDMAWALTLADRKWGGHGSLSSDYLALAKSMISKIWNREVDHSGSDLINAGDSWGSTFAWNPSYFAPNEYRTFAKIDTANAAGWNKIIDKGYAVLAACQNSTTGLFPAWASTSGTPSAPWAGGPTNYQYDAARVPFRIGLDYCDNNESRAKAILARTSSFFSGLGASAIVDGYSLTGTASPENTSPAGVQSALFVGAAGVGAMSNSSYQSFVNAVYVRLVSQPDELMLPKSYYFNLSWKVFSLLMMSGNLFDYSLHT